MSIMIHIPKFGHRLASAQAKDERLDWIISQLKKNKRFDLKKLSEFERLEVEEFIQEHCRALRLSRLTRQEYTNQILFDIGLAQ